MKRFSLSRQIQWCKLLACGAVLLQTSGCSTGDFIVFLQTIFLGITAAGAVAILQNI